MAVRTGRPKAGSNRAGRKETISFRATWITRRRLEKLAEKFGISMSDLLIDLIDNAWNEVNFDGKEE
jgi:hypothetical protein